MAAAPSGTDATAPPPVSPRMPRAFRQLLTNTLATSVTSTFLWFALTFWVYIETRSVGATGVIGGAFSLSSAFLGPLFGTFVDRHRKHSALVLPTAVSVVCFVVATILYTAVDSGDLLRLRSPWFWLLIAMTLLGSVAGQMRGIALSTCVTLLSQRRRGTVRTAWSAPSLGFRSPSRRCSAAS